MVSVDLPSILGLIPARGGSKGVPRKNARLLGGRPLVEWSVTSGLASTRLADVVVSTDDEEIASIARAAGADVPFLRPAHLADDAAPTLPVVQHALDELGRAGRTYDAVCLLQPTSPFRTAADIDTAVDEWQRRGAATLMSVRPIPADHHPAWALLRSADGTVAWAMGTAGPPTRRQDLAPAFHRDGAIYITSVTTICSGSLYGDPMAVIVLEEPAAINIDTPDDWAAAEAEVARRPT